VLPSKLDRTSKAIALIVVVKDEIEQALSTIPQLIKALEGIYFDDNPCCGKTRPGPSLDVRTLAYIIGCLSPHRTSKSVVIDGWPELSLS